MSATRYCGEHVDLDRDRQAEILQTVLASRRRWQLKEIAQLSLLLAGWPIKAIAEYFGCRGETVARNIQRAKAFLRHDMGWLASREPDRRRLDQAAKVRVMFPREDYSLLRQEAKRRQVSPGALIRLLLRGELEKLRQAEQTDETTEDSA